MKICAFVLIALVAIAAAQQDTLTNDQRQKLEQIQECLQRIGEPCQIDNNQVKEACQNEVDLLGQCFEQCINDNKETTNNIIGCAQLNCKSQNNIAQTFFDQKTVCMAILEENPSNNDNHDSTSTDIDTPSTSKDEKKINLDQENINNTETPCQAGSEEEIKACDEELNKLENCL